MIRIFVVILLAAAHCGAHADRDNETWLLVDTGTSTLSVMNGDRPRLTLENIAIGRFGTSHNKRRGDNTTPLGRFRVTRIERDSPFHRFIGLDYPDVGRAERGYREGVIEQRELQQILTAHKQNRAPSQGTALGGYIGIHGLGRGDPDVHATMNWTKGCVALTNEQIETVLSLATIGMRVVIR